MGKKNIVYISNQNIQILSGSADSNDMIKIDNFIKIPILEGSMINGVITDDQDLKEHLKEVKEQGINDCILVIDSGQILTKNVVVPFMGKKELIQFTKDELATLEATSEDLVYDYAVLKERIEGSKTGEILCCGVERKLIASYIELFESVDIKLNAIDISINAVNKLIQELPELENKTYIISILDGHNVSSFLFENNKYVFSNHARFFADRGSDAFAIEMSGNISQMIQFNKSQHSEHAIEVAYFCNLDSEEEKIVCDRIQDNLNIKAEKFPTSMIYVVKDPAKKALFELNQYIFPAGGMIRK